MQDLLVYVHDFHCPSTTYCELWRPNPYM